MITERDHQLPESFQSPGSCVEDFVKNAIYDLAFLASLPQLQGEARCQPKGLTWDVIYDGSRFDRKAINALRHAIARRDSLARRIMYQFPPSELREQEKLRHRMTVTQSQIVNVISSSGVISTNKRENPRETSGQSKPKKDSRFRNAVERVPSMATSLAGSAFAVAPVTPIVHQVVNLYSQELQNPGTTLRNDCVSSENVSFAVGTSTNQGNTLTKAYDYPNGDMECVWQLAGGETYTLIRFKDGTIIDKENEVNERHKTNQQLVEAQTAPPTFPPATISTAPVQQEKETTPEEYACVPEQGELVVIPQGTIIENSIEKYPANSEFISVRTDATKERYRINVGPIKIGKQVYAQICFTDGSSAWVLDDKIKSLSPIEPMQVPQVNQEPPQASTATPETTAPSEPLPEAKETIVSRREYNLRGFDDMGADYATNARQNIGLFVALMNNPNITKEEYLPYADNEVNGVILLEPGQTFDFIKTYKEFLISNSYSPSGVIGLPSATGGGACQGSQTLYNAAKDLGLSPISNAKHKDTPYDFDPNDNMLVSIVTDVPNTPDQNLEITNTTGNTIQFRFFYDPKNGKLTVTAEFLIPQIAPQNPAPSEAPTLTPSVSELPITFSVRDLMTHDPKHPALEMIPDNIKAKYPWTSYMPNDVMYWLPEMILSAQEVIDVRKSKGLYVGNMTAEEYAVIYSRIIDMESGGGPLCLSISKALGLTAVMPVNFFNTLHQMGDISSDEFSQLIKDGKITPTMIDPYSLPESLVQVAKNGQLTKDQILRLTPNQLANINIKYEIAGGETRTHQFAIDYNNSKDPIEEWYFYEPTRNIRVGMTFFATNYFQALYFENTPGYEAERCNTDETDPIYRAYLRSCRIYNGGGDNDCAANNAETAKYNSKAPALLYEWVYHEDPSKELRTGWPGYNSSQQQWGQLGINPVGKYFKRGEDIFAKVRTHPIKR